MVAVEDLIATMLLGLRCRHCSSQKQRRRSTPRLYFSPQRASQSSELWLWLWLWLWL